MSWEMVKQWFSSAPETSQAYDYTKPVYSVTVAFDLVRLARQSASDADKAVSIHLDLLKAHVLALAASRRADAPVTMTMTLAQAEWVLEEELRYRSTGESSVPIVHVEKETR